jgi:RNA polymerase sigma-70 factor, ECF subfamily
VTKHHELPRPSHALSAALAVSHAPFVRQRLILLERIEEKARRAPRFFLVFALENSCVVEQPGANLEEDPGRWRQYLAVLAEIQVSPGLRNRIDISGVVQQTLLEALRDRRSLSGGPKGEAAWLRRILAHNLADEVRKLHAGKRDVARERSLEAALDESSARFGELLAANQSSPSQRATRDEDAVRLAAALAGLPESQREALLLQHWHGWSLARIAEHQGKSTAAVAGLIKRGLAGLRKHLSPE